MKKLATICSVLTIAILSSCSQPANHEQTTAVNDPLPSWNEGDAKQAILDFVATVTDPASPDFVPEPERIATFDNDGNLWAEKPVYFQLLFAIDRVKALAAEHPEWKGQQPFKSVLEDDMESLLAQGEHGLIQLVMATHAGMTTEEFERTVSEWLDTARHPTTGRDMRMGIEVGGAAVGRPPGVPDPGGRGNHRIGRQQCLEVGQLAGLLAHIERAVRDDGHACRVVPAVLQAGEARHHHVDCLPVARVPHDSAHGR